MAECRRLYTPDTEYDNKGAYSGSALPLGDNLYLYYTGTKTGRAVLTPALSI